MFPQTLDKCQDALTHEGGKAVDALTVATAAFIGDARKEVILDANEQEAIAAFWHRNLPTLMKKAHSELGSKPTLQPNDLRLGI